MSLPLSPLFLANLVLLVLAITIAIIMLSASVRYRRHIGDIPTQTANKYTVLHSLIILIAIGLIASAINLIFS